jgi:tRNA pseudouridine55 synthase
LSGEDVVVPEREVEIYGIEILGFSPPDLSLSVSCSSGTYVRSLARDLARATGSRAHVVELERLSVGPFSLEAAAPPDEITDTAVVPFEVFVPKIPMLGIAEISDAGRRAMDRGGRIATSSLEMSRPTTTTDGPVAVFGRDGRFLGIVDSSGDRIRYVFNRGSDS